MRRRSGVRGSAGAVRDLDRGAALPQGSESGLDLELDAGEAHMQVCLAQLGVVPVRRVVQNTARAQPDHLNPAVLSQRSGEAPQLGGADEKVRVAAGGSVGWPQGRVERRAFDVQDLDAGRVRYRLECRVREVDAEGHRNGREVSHRIAPGPGYAQGQSTGPQGWQRPTWTAGSRHSAPW